MNDDYKLDLPPTQERVAALAKLYTPIFKQLITLSASAIGLVIVFMEKFVSEVDTINMLVAFALFSFLGSLLGSFLMYFKMMMMHLPDEGERLFNDKFEWSIFWLAFMGFNIGVICLMMVALLNFINTLTLWILGGAGIAMIFFAGLALWKKIQRLRKISKSLAGD